jgi:UTP-glucose-1-phosphate uridylyltransferase
MVSKRITCHGVYLPTLVILAGGLGTRFGGNKQIAELPQLGCSIMELSIIDAEKAGIKNVILVINQSIKQHIETHILPRISANINVTLVIQDIKNIPEKHRSKSTQRKKPWGTGHALWCARQYVKSNAIVITADDYYGANALKQLTQHFMASSGADKAMAMVAYPIERTLSDQGGVNRGVCQIHEGQLDSVVEYLDIFARGNKMYGVDSGTEKEIEQGALCSMTCWGVTNAVFKELEEGFEKFLQVYDNDVKKEYYLPDAVQTCVDQKSVKVTVYQASEPWFGVTYKEELDLIAGKIYGSRQG